MTQLHILQLAIDKAVKNGYRGQSELVVRNFQIVVAYPRPNPPTEIDIDTMLFSRGFAEAFWGDADMEVLETVDLGPEPHAGQRYDSRTKVKKVWQYHLQQIAISENHINYLSQFVKNNY